MASFVQSLGLSLQISDPLWYSNRASYGAPGEIESWEHEIAADGGYKSASFTIQADKQTVERWLERGLGRHVECYDAALAGIGEYFVNRVVGNIGSLSVTRGPLLNVANRVGVAYTPYLDICEPPETGTATVTTLAEDATSQDLYGIQEVWVSGGTLIDDTTTANECGGGTLDNEAEEIRDAYLEENKEPETTQEISFGGGGTSLTLDCLGYSAWLERYAYSASATGYTTASAKMIDVLASDTNSLISQEFGYVQDNGILVKQEETENRTAKAIIDEIVSMGDVNDSRWTFGIYAERKVYYSAIPTAIEYLHRLMDGRQAIETTNGNTVFAWNVLPARWLFIPDFMVGRAKPITDLRLDPRCVFIESVRYTAPYGLQINGAKVGRFAQLMAKKGLA